MKLEKIYLDTNIVILSVEAPGQLQATADDFKRHVYQNEIQVITSRVTLAECLYKPLREKNEYLVNFYRYLLLDSKIRTIDINNHILDSATRIGPQFRLHLLDAIHLATALSANCTAIISNDTAWQKFTEIPVYDFTRFLAELGGGA